jgi:small subunit ribosomal protein S3
MGRKIVPTSLRLGINKDWKGNWYANKRDFAALVGSDIDIKKYVTKSLNPSGLESITIDRYPNRVEVIVYVAKPGVAIGRGGAGIEIIQKEIKKLVKMTVELKIKEVKKPDLSARIIARSIADGIERRQPSKLLIASAKDKAMLSGAKGIKIMVSGRINNNPQARSQKDVAGPVPTQTLKANIDYAEETAATNDSGLFGVKVWVYKKDENLDAISR